MFIQLSGFSELRSFGKDSNIPIIFTSLLSQLFNLKSNFLETDTHFDISEHALNEALIFSIFQRSFKNTHIAQVVISYCVAVSTIKVLMEVEQQLLKSKNNLEICKNKLDSTHNDWVKFMPYPDDGKIEKEIQDAYQTLIQSEGSFDQVSRIARRAFKNLHRHLELLKVHNVDEYEQAFTEIVWVEYFFADQNSLERLQLMVHN